MITISLCMIVKDEEAVLARCLSSIAPYVDEIIIIDTGSKDGTKEIAASFGAKIYDFKWVDHFAAARNFSFSKATMEYIMWLDADDVLLEEHGRLLQELKQTLDTRYNAVTMPYHLGLDSAGEPLFVLRRHRLVKRACNFKWIGAVHEYLEVYGPVFHSDVCITHMKEKRHTDRNLRIYRAMQARGEPFSPRDLYYFANELCDHHLYEEACTYYHRFLDTGRGWVEDNIQACMKLAHCYKQLKKREMVFQSLCRALRYDKPRGEVCYLLGEYFLEENQVDLAIFWFNLALLLPVPKESMGLRNTAMTTWMPHLQLAVCYSKLQKYQQAQLHNELAAEYVPDHPSVLHNRRYFERVLAGRTEPSDQPKTSTAP